jgi:hypothetical protein
MPVSTGGTGVPAGGHVHRVRQGLGPAEQPRRVRPEVRRYAEAEADDRHAVAALAQRLGRDGGEQGEQRGRRAVAEAAGEEDPAAALRGGRPAGDDGGHRVPDGVVARVGDAQQAGRLAQPGEVGGQVRSRRAGDQDGLEDAVPPAQPQVEGAQHRVGGRCRPHRPGLPDRHPSTRHGHHPAAPGL